MAQSAHLWAPFAERAAEETGTPEPRRRDGPVLMGDIVTALGREPLLLINWRRDAGERDDPTRR